MAQEEIKVVTVIDDAGSTKTIKDLRKEIAGYKDELVNLERGSKEYNDVLEKLGQNQAHVNDIMEDSKFASMDMVDGFAVATKAASVLSAGMSAYNSIAALSGVENEALQETFVKLQAGMALTQSLQAMAGGIKTANAAFKAFNATLLANPIILVATAIIALVAGLAILGNSLADQKSGVAQLNTEYDNHKKQIETTNTLRNREVDIMKAQGASTLEVIEWRRKQIAEDIENAKIEIKLREEEIKALEKKNKAWFSGERKRLKALKTIQGEESERLTALLGELDQLNHEFSVETIKTETATADEKNKIAKKAKEERLKLENDLNKSILKLEEERDKREKEVEKSKNSTKYLENEIELNKKLQESLNAVINDPDSSLTAKLEATNKLIIAEGEYASLQQELLTEQNTYNEAIKALENDRLERLKEIKKESVFDNDKIQFIENEIDANKQLQDSLNAIINDPDASYKAKTQAINDLIVAETTYAELQAGLLEAQTIATEQKIELERLLQEAQGFPDMTPEDIKEMKQAEAEEEINRLWDIANNTSLSYDERIKALNAYNKAVKSKEDADKASVANEKKLQNQKLDIIGSALDQGAKLLGENTVASKAMQVASATINTYQAASMALAETPGPAKYVAMAVAIAAGLANVKSILQTKVPGASGDSGGGSSSITPPTMPEMKEPIQETHNNMTAYEEDIINKPQRVYVVESDITNVQNNVKTAVSESTF